MSHKSFAQLRLSKGGAAIAVALFAVMFGLAFVFAPGRSIFATILLSATLAWLVSVDLDRLRLPNLLTLPLIIMGIAFSIATKGPVIHCVIGASVGYGVFWLISVAASSVLKKPALGLGDAKLLAAFGAWVGWAALPTILLIGSIVGIAHALINRWKAGRNTGAIPFGPSLVAGFWTVWILGPIGGWPY